MTNYEKIMSQMTPESMAESNVKLVTVNGTALFYLTSSGQLYAQSRLNDAINHEYNWLLYDDEVQNNTSNVKSKPVEKSTQTVSEDSDSEDVKD